MDCLSTPLILWEIFHNIPSNELLKLSLVNKQWNYEARSLIRNRGDLAARINKNGTCQELRAFASDLRRMIEMKKVIPFSGMTIAVGGCRWGRIVGCEESSTGELDDVYADMLEQKAWKNLTVTFHSTWDKCTNCPAFLLVRKVFQRYCCILEELSLTLEKKLEFIQAVLQGCSFPRLKTLRFPIRKYTPVQNRINADDTILIKLIVSTAPNLQILYTEDRLDLNANLLEGSSAVHLTDFTYSPCLDEIPENIAGELRMKRIKLDWIGPEFNIERFNRITFTMLESSRMTLSSMEIVAIFLVPLMRYGISLGNVRTLSIIFTRDSQEICQPAIWRLVKYFDFKRVFPNLSTARILWRFTSESLPLSYFFNDMIEQENAAFIELMLDRAENIKNLIVEWDTCIQDSYVQFFAQIFPDIQKFAIESTHVPFTSIWGSWPDLKELDVRKMGLTSKEKFDGVFCGIFPEEVARLQEEDEGYLQRVNLVPVMPSITCLRGLRTLSMSFLNYQCWIGKTTNDPTCMLSKVTGLTALVRSPGLTVTLKTDDDMTKEALSHLKPYASVTLGKLTYL